jgi:hypothetical protein
MEICLTGDNKFVWKKVLFPVAVVIGDCKGNDTLAGKYGSHTGVNRISRACNCPMEKADDVKFNCQFVTQQEVHDALLVNDENERNQLLQSMSQHHIRNAFHDVCFGGDVHGIHGCTPLDAVCHASQLGTYKYAMKHFFSLLKTTATATFDQYVQKIFQLPSQRASNELPKTDFGKGISNITGLTAKEYSGCIFVLALILATDIGQSVANKAFGTALDSNKRTLCRNFHYLFEMLLCFEQWVSKPEYWEASNYDAAESARESIRVLLMTIKRVAKRSDGYQWKITKFHEFLHLVWYIERFGCPHGFAADMGEKIIKPLLSYQQTLVKRFMPHSMSRR